MKKTSVYCVIVLLFVMLQSCEIEQLKKDAIESEIVDETRKMSICDFSHGRTSEYPVSFSGVCFSDDYLSVYFDKKIYNESRSPEIAAEVELAQEKYAELSNDEVHHLNVFFVETTANGNVISNEEGIFCGIDDYMTSSYFAVLARELGATHLPYGNAIGLGELICNYRPTSAEDKVCMWINQNSPENFLSLFPAFFWNEYSDEDGILMAEDCAYYVAKYAAENNILFENEGIDLMESWSKDKNIEKTFHNDFVDKSIAKMKVDSGYRSNHSLADERMIFNCQPVSWLSNASALYSFLKLYYEDIGCVVGELKEKAPLWYDDYSKNNSVYEVVFNEKSNTSLISYTDSAKGVIFIGRPHDIVHEYLHIFFEYAHCLPEWLDEGMVLLYTEECSAKHIEGNAMDLQLLSEDFANEYEGLDSEYLKLYRQRYLDVMGFLPSDIEECNFFIGFLAEGYAEWKFNACDISQDIRTLTVMEKTHSNKEGNDMTYSQAYLFCEYMTEIYGDDFMIESLKSEDSFEVTYGKKYSEIRADFLKQMYE